MTRRNKGFTLIELLVVISIIALLVGILLPALGKARLAARNIIGQSDQRQVAISMHIYASTNNGYFPTNHQHQRADWGGAPNSAEEPTATNGMISSAGWQLYSRVSTDFWTAGTPSGNQYSYTGLGSLVGQGLIGVDAFFHPVMQEAFMTSGGARRHWWYRDNIGFTGTLGTEPVPNGPVGGASGFTNTHTWASDPRIAGTIGFRSADRSTFVGGTGVERRDLSYLLTDHNLTAGSTILFPCPFENFGNRAGGSLPYTRGDGSGFTFGRDGKTSIFFGTDRDLNSSSGAGCSTANGDGKNSDGIVVTNWYTGNFVGNSGPAHMSAGWMAWEIDNAFGLGD